MLSTYHIEQQSTKTVKCISPSLFLFFSLFLSIYLFIYLSIYLSIYLYIYIYT